MSVTINFCPMCGDRVQATERLCHKCNYDLNDYRGDIERLLPPAPAPTPEDSTQTNSKIKFSKTHIIVLALSAAIFAAGYFVLPHNEQSPTPAPEVIEKPAPKVVEEPAHEVIEEPAQILDAHWIKDSRDVYLWNPEPQDGESITWSGGFVQDGNYKFANGSGIVTWYRNGEIIQVDEGTFEHGRHHGQFKHTFKSGRVEYSNWAHGMEINSAEAQARQAFLDYHLAITNEKYEAAYSMLTAEQKQRVGDLRTYSLGYVDTLSSEVSDLSTVSASDESVTFNYRLIARDWPSDTVKITVQVFEGQVTLVKINGRWYINYAKSKKIDQWTEG